MTGIGAIPAIARRLTLAFAVLAAAAAAIPAPASAGKKSETVATEAKTKTRAFERAVGKSCNSSFCTIDVYTVPSGKRLELGRVSCNASIAGNSGITGLSIEKLVGGGGNPIAEFLTPVETGTLGGFYFISSSNQFDMTLKTTDVLRIFANADDAISTMNCRVTGKLVLLN